MLEILPGPGGRPGVGAGKTFIGWHTTCSQAIIMPSQILSAIGMKIYFHLFILFA